MTPRKIASFALGPIGGALLAFITLPLITWFFSQEDVGRLSMLNIATSFGILFFSLGLDQAYVREFHETDSTPALFKTVLLPGLSLLIISLIVLIALDNTISNFLFEIDSLFLSIAVAIIMIAMFIARFLSLILRMNERGIAYSMSQVLPKALLLLIIATYVIFNIDKSFKNLVIANLASTLLICGIYTWNTRKEWLPGLKQKIDFSYLKQLLAYGFPLIFGGLAFWGLTATDRIMLKELSNFEQVGLYSVAVSFAAAATIFQSIFSTVWAPTVYKWAAANEGFENIYKVNRYVLLIVICFFCLAGLFSWVVNWILPDNYEEVRWIVISCLGYPLLYTLSETTVVGIGITRRSGLALIASAIAFIVNLIGSFILVPYLGATGAAVSTCFSFWVFFIIRTELSIYAWRKIPRLALYCYSTIAMVGATMNSIYGQLYTQLFAVFWIILLISLPLAFKEEVEDMKALVKRQLNLISHK